MPTARHLVQFEVRQGNPYRELLAVAEELRVDAVVIGASMSSAAGFVGSLAGRLVRDSVWAGDGRP